MGGKGRPFAPANLRELPLRPMWYARSGGEDLGQVQLLRSSALVAWFQALAK